LVVCFQPQGAFAQLSHFPEPHNTGSNMSVLIAEVRGVVVVESTELALFTPDSIVAGATVLSGDPSWGMAAWGDDEFTEEIDGFNTGDTLRFVLWDPVRETELPAEADVEQGSLLWRVNTFTAVKLVVSAPDLPPTPPEWKEIPADVKEEEGSLIEFRIMGRDLNGDSLNITFTSPDLPDAVQFTDHGGGSGTFRWLTTLTDSGSYTAHFTLSDGIFDTTARVGIKVIDVVSNPDYYNLKGPYPNPFNVQARLRFELPDDAGVTLEALDLLGRRITVLEEGVYSPGIYYAHIDATKFGSGSYLFRLEAGDIQQFTMGVVVR